MSTYPFYTSKNISDTRKLITFKALCELQKTNEGTLKTIDVALVKGLTNIGEADTLEAVRIAEGKRGETFYKCVFTLSGLAFPLFAELYKTQWESL